MSFGSQPSHLMLGFGKNGSLKAKAWMVMSSEMPVDHEFVTVLGRRRKGGAMFGSIAEKRERRLA